MSIRDDAFLGKPVPCRVIDAHTHLCAYHINGWHQKYDQTDTALVLHELERLGFDSIVTSPHPMIQARMEEANAIADAAAKQFPGKVYGYITIVPVCGMDSIKAQLSRYQASPNFVGLKFLTGYHGSLLQPEYAYAMDFADEMRCPVLCHEWGNIPDRAEFVSALQTRRHMKLIIAHQGGGSAADTLSCASIISDHENAYLELCGSLYNQLSIDEIASLLGEDKIIFGTDAIDLDPKYELGKVAFSRLSDSIKQKIFAGNFLRLLNDSLMGHIS